MECSVPEDLIYEASVDTQRAEDQLITGDATVPFHNTTASSKKLEDSICPFCKFKSTCPFHPGGQAQYQEDTFKKFSCEYCGKKFLKSSLADEHRHLHTRETPFQCEICGKNFMYSITLALHRKNVHCELLTGEPQRKYGCVPCKIQYNSQSGLLRHNYKHHRDPGLPDLTDTQWVVCEICGKKFRDKYRLKMHLITHTDYKPYPCQFCSKAFRTRVHLVEHERLHTGEKPYQCESCGKCFPRKTPYRNHLKMHAGDRKFPCSHCSKAFVTRSIMKTHVKSCRANIKKELN